MMLPVHMRISLLLALMVVPVFALVDIDFLWTSIFGGSDESADRASEESEDLRSSLVSTEWHWNGWRHIKFHAPTRGSEHAKFHAPTEDCENNLCTWYVQGDKVFIRWGDAGLHTLHRDGNRLTGNRNEDGAPCTAVLVGGFEETLYDLDLYAVLGVPQDASSHDVKRAFRRLSLAAHPDKRRGAAAASTREFVTLRGAVEILSDPAERSKYDAHCRALAASTQSHHVAALDLATFDAHMRGGGGGRGGGRAGSGGGGDNLAWLVIFTMSPSSPCGPCHELRAIVRTAATALRGRLRVGTVHCDVHTALCRREMQGRDYYPVVKVYTADDVGGHYLDLKQPELPSAAVLHLTVSLLDAIGYRGDAAVRDDVTDGIEQPPEPEGEYAKSEL